MATVISGILRLSLSRSLSATHKFIFPRLSAIYYPSGGPFMLAEGVCLYGTVPRKRWKTSNNRPPLEFTGLQPNLLYCSSRLSFFFFFFFSLPAKSRRLKYGTPWQWLLLQAGLGLLGTKYE